MYLYYVIFKHDIDTNCDYQNKKSLTQANTKTVQLGRNWHLLLVIVLGLTCIDGERLKTDQIYFLNALNTPKNHWLFQR